MSETDIKAASCDSDLVSVMRAVLAVLPFGGVTVTRRAFDGGRVFEAEGSVDCMSIHAPSQSPEKDVA